MLVLISLAVLGSILGLLYNQRNRIKVWMLEQIMQYYKLKTANSEAAPASYDKSLGHLRIEYVYNSLVYTTFIPYVPRRGAGYTAYMDIKFAPEQELEPIVFKHPPGLAFPTTAAALGADSITRRRVSGDEVVARGDSRVA